MKVSVVGIGKVGSTLAYTLAIRDLCQEIVLVSRNREVAQGDAYDLQHAQSFVSAPASISAGGIKETADSDIIAFCASAPMEPSSHIRRMLGPANVQVLRDLLPGLVERSPNAVLLILSNPVDVLTYYAIQISGFPSGRVIGTGTFIDSARFRMMLSEELGIHPDDLRAYILGEHGASQFPAMSVAVAGGEHIANTDERQRIFEKAREAGNVIFQHKGYTNYAIAMAATAIIESIVRDERHTMPVSILIDGYQGVTDVCLSLPAVVGREGVCRVLHPKLSATEAEAFRASAKVVREGIGDADLTA